MTAERSSSEQDGVSSSPPTTELELLLDALQAAAAAGDAECSRMLRILQQSFH